MCPGRLAAVLIVLALPLLLGIYYFGSFLSRVPIYARTPEGIAAAKEKRMAIFNAFIPHKWPLLDLLADFAVVLVAHVGAYLLRFEGQIEGENVRMLTRSLPIVIGARLLSFQLFGLYRRVTGHFSISDVVAVAKAVASSSLVTVTILVIAFKFDGFSRAVVIIDAALAFGMVVAGHASISFLSEMFRGRARGTIRTVIVGAGDLGSAAAGLLRRDPSSHRTIVAYLDDDPLKIGRRLNGIAVDGPIDRLEEVIRSNERGRGGHRHVAAGRRAPEGDPAPLRGDGALRPPRHPGMTPGDGPRGVDGPSSRRPLSLLLTWLTLGSFVPRQSRGRRAAPRDRDGGLQRLRRDRRKSEPSRFEGWSIGPSGLDLVPGGRGVLLLFRLCARAPPPFCSPGSIARRRASRTRSGSRGKPKLLAATRAQRPSPRHARPFR